MPKLNAATFWRRAASGGILLLLLVTISGCGVSTVTLAVAPPMGSSAALADAIAPQAPPSMITGGISPGAAPVMQQQPGEAPLQPAKLGRMNTEEYDRIYENEFLPVAANPLSTFAIDVDTASFSNVRRFLTNNTLPPADAVRIEELINYFNYDYPQPNAGHPFALVTERSICPWNTAHQLLHVGLQGKRIPTKNLPPANLVFLLDVSGSMNEPNKLPLLKRALGLLTRTLRPQDKVAIVVYAGAAGLILPPTPGNRTGVILKALEGLRAGGSTAGGKGIQLAYATAKEHFVQGGNNRVILATDGDFNVGVSSDGELTRLIEAKREAGIFLTILGFGSGNYKDSKMEQLADTGNGNYAYIDNIREAKKVLVTEFSSTLLTIAKDVKIQIEFNPTQVQAYRLIGYENRLLKQEDFRDDTKDAGELGSGHSVTALYELIPAGSSEETGAPIRLKYQSSATVKPEAQQSSELVTIKLRYKRPLGSKSTLVVQPVTERVLPLKRVSLDFSFSAAVAEFGLLLRNSKFKAQASYQQVLDLAKTGKGPDPEGLRAEFIRLVEQAQLLSLTGQ